MANPALPHPAPLPPALTTLVAKIRKGQRLLVTHGEDGDTYTLEPSGEVVRGPVAAAAIVGALVAPCGDGLFDARSSQTFGA